MNASAIPAYCIIRFKKFLHNVIHLLQGRKKRSPGSGPERSNPIVVSLDVQNEAKFLRTYLNLDRDMKNNISHHLLSQETRLGTTLLGMIVSCTYSGMDCSDSR